jgi:hypothetical protein
VTAIRPTAYRFFAAAFFAGDLEAFGLDFPLQGFDACHGTL